MVWWFLLSFPALRAVTDVVAVAVLLQTYRWDISAFMEVRCDIRSKILLVLMVTTNATRQHPFSKCISRLQTIHTAMARHAQIVSQIYHPLQEIHLIHVPPQLHHVPTEQKYSVRGLGTKKVMKSLVVIELDD